MRSGFMAAPAPPLLPSVMRFSSFSTADVLAMVTLGVGPAGGVTSCAGSLACPAGAVEGGRG